MEAINECKNHIYVDIFLYKDKSLYGEMHVLEIESNVSVDARFTGDGYIGA